MQEINEFRKFTRLLADHFQAEQKMLFHTQVSELANVKMIKSAALLYQTIIQIQEIPEATKQLLQTAITKRDIPALISISNQVHQIINVLCAKYLPKSK